MLCAYDDVNVRKENVTKEITGENVLPVPHCSSRCCEPVIVSYDELSLSAPASTSSDVTQENLQVYVLPTLDSKNEKIIRKRSIYRYGSFCIDNEEAAV